MTDPIATPFTDIVFPTGELQGSSVVMEATHAGVAVVNLNRPGRKNAFDSEMIGALTEVFTTLKASEHVRTVFIRGVGGAFCAGADLNWMRDAAEFDESQNREDSLELARMLKGLWDLPQLTVALVEGPAFGGGAGLACACDMALATPDALFSFSEVKLGLIPAVISPYVIQAIGPRASRALFATGARFGAEEAQRLGLVERVVADAASLHDAARAIAHGQAACAPGAVAASKRLVAEVAGRDIDRDLLDLTARRIAAQRVSEEGREGVAAFLGKRKASWTA